jgi:hypothetical protein
VRRFEVIIAAEPPDSFVWPWLRPGTYLRRNYESVKIIGSNRFTGKLLVRR